MRLILILLLTLNLLTAKNVALLIGNSEYEYLDKLDSPKKDIPDLAQKLREMGFKVIELYDLDEKRMKKVIRNFKNYLLKNPKSIALFYYSGHGSQAYGESYLIPIDGNTKDEEDVEADGIKVETIAKKMANSGTVANILFLDACRDVPIGKKGGTKGLGQVKRQPSSTLILYSTSKNHTANDDRVFNQTVLSKLTFNIPLSSLANNISYAVGQKTNGEQVPEILSTGLPPNICLGGKCKDVLKPQEIGSANSSTNNPNIVTIDGLMYQNQPFTKRYNWKEAKEYCQNLTLGGYSDWRLPTRAELHKISNIQMYGEWDDNFIKWFNKNKHRRYKNSKNHYYFIKKEFIENMPKFSWFWTSEERDSSDAWYVYFKFGNDNWYDKTVKGYALCVRGQ